MTSSLVSSLPTWAEWVAVDSDGLAHAFDRCPRFHAPSGSWQVASIGNEVARVHDVWGLEADGVLTAVPHEEDGYLFIVEHADSEGLPAALWFVLVAAFVVALAIGSGNAPAVRAWLSGDVP